MDSETHKPLVQVDDSMIDKLRDHQVKGIQFMYENCFESIEAIKAGHQPAGCILAHCKLQAKI